MNIQSHWKLASLICKSSEFNIKGLKRFIFTFGNIFPDISFTFVRRPHIPSIMYDEVIHRIENAMHLTKKENHLNYFSLGIITHYLADFFCAAHTEPFGNDPRTHYLYEQQLLFHINSCYDIIESMHVFEQYEDLIPMIENSHKEYLKNTFSHNKDIRFITKICMSCVYAYQSSIQLTQNEFVTVETVISS